MTKKKLVWSTRPCQVHQKKTSVAFYTFNVLVYFYKLLIKRKPPGFYKVLTKQKNIQFNANQMNKSRARIEFYTGPAFIHLVCIKLYLLPLNERHKTKTKCKFKVTEREVNRPYPWSKLTHTSINSISTNLEFLQRHCMF